MGTIEKVAREGLETCLQGHREVLMSLGCVKTAKKPLRVPTRVRTVDLQHVGLT